MINCYSICSLQVSVFSLQIKKHLSVTKICIVNSLADARESTLSALHAFASSGQRFERVSLKQTAKTKTKKNKIKIKNK